MCRFVIEKTWERHNGSLKLQSVVGVNTAGFKYRDCFDKIKITRRYVLILSPQENNVFAALAPPLLSEKAGTNHRRFLWKKLCTTLEDGRTCKMRVTISPFQIFYIGRIELITCEVETSSPIVDMTWLKDGKSVDKNSYRNVGVCMNREGDNAYIAIYNANRIHNGKYECIVKAEDGQEAKATTNVEVHGPEEVKDLKCEREHFCLNGGTCQQYSPKIQSCHCLDGFTGHRCETVIAFESKTTDEPANESASQLTVGIALVSAAFVCVLLFGSVYVFNLRRRLRRTKNVYDAVDQHKSDTSTSSNVLSGTELLTIPASVANVSESMRLSQSNARTPHRSANTTRHSSARSSRYEGAMLTPSIRTSSRHTSIESDASSRRGRLYAKS